MNNTHRFIALGALSSLAACSGMPTGKLSDAEQTQMNQLVAQAPQPLAPAVARLYQEGERNAVLNFNRVGLSAMEVGEMRIAERAFDQSIQRIEAIYANNDQAKKAKSVFAEERVKDFKGEPYERAMTYYYRGLLYLHAGDYQNARAAFLSAEYQDTVSYREEYAGDFAVMNFLAGWSSLCDGDRSRGQELIQAAAEVRPSLKLIDPSSRFLAVIETGAGPVKVGKGKHKELLTFDEAPAGDDAQVKFVPPATRVAGLEANTGRSGSGPISTTYYSQAANADDLYFQASTRGGRPVQGILDGKAQFKDVTKAVGEAATAVGAGVAMSGAVSNNSDMAGVGAIIGLIGIAMQVASDAAKPTADTRTWTTLPRNLYLAGGGTTNEAQPDFKIEYGEGAGTKIAPLAYWGKRGNCSVAWGRTRSSVTANSAPMETSSQPRDKSFRAALANVFAREESGHEN